MYAYQICYFVNWKTDILNNRTNIDGLVQDYTNSIANALKSCTEPSIYYRGETGERALSLPERTEGQTKRHKTDRRAVLLFRGTW